MVSRAVEQIASKTKLADGCGDSDSRCEQGVREPMGYRAAMRGRRRVSRGCAWVGRLRCASCWVVVSVGGGDETAETGGCFRSTKCKRTSSTSSLEQRCTRPTKTGSNGRNNSSSNKSISTSLPANIECTTATSNWRCSTDRSATSSATSASQSWRRPARLEELNIPTCVRTLGAIIFALGRTHIILASEA